MMESWIQTFTGRKFYPLDPDPDAIDIRDIAHSLSLHCRFNGHCRTFYSVADHSVRVSRTLYAEDALWGLLHDASEAYLSDVPKPLKKDLPEYQAAEEHLMRVIAERFRLPWPIPETVHRVDRQLLMTERRDLVGEPIGDWGIDATPLPERIVPLDPPDAERAFLARFDQLIA